MVRGFETGIFTGGLNVLLWISYVIMLALYSYAFGGYAASFFPKAAQPIWRHVFISTIMIIFTALNSLGSKLVGESQLSDMLILAGMIGGSFIIEIIDRRFTGREIKSKS